MIRLVIALALIVTVNVARAESETKCSRDSAGRPVCVTRDRKTGERCTTTCRKDSRGNMVCSTRCG